MGSMGRSWRVFSGSEGETGWQHEGCVFCLHGILCDIFMIYLARSSKQLAVYVLQCGWYQLFFWMVLGIQSFSFGIMSSTTLSFLAELTVDELCYAWAWDTFDVLMDQNFET